MDVLLPFALILVAFYFLILRPQRARARQAGHLQARLAPGVEIMTTAGIFATVMEIQDDVLTLEISPGATMRVTKAAVGRILTEDGAPEPTGPTEPTEPADPDEVDAPDLDGDPGRRNSPGE